MTALACPWVLLTLQALFFPRRRTSAVVTAAIVLTYSLSIASVHFLNAEIDARLQSFDLNGDGGFSGAELTPEYQAAMNNYQNDTGRALAPITAAIFSSLYCVLAWGIWSMFRKAVGHGNRIASNKPLERTRGG